MEGSLRARLYKNKSLYCLGSLHQHRGKFSAYFGSNAMNQIFFFFFKLQEATLNTPSLTIIPCERAIREQLLDISSVCFIFLLKIPIPLLLHPPAPHGLLYISDNPILSPAVKALLIVHYLSVSAQRSRDGILVQTVSPPSPESDALVKALKTRKPATYQNCI